ncbi:unnamed protein product, partial [Cylicostephanus goldi]
LCEEEDEDEPEEKEVSEEQFAHCDLGTLRDYLNSDEVKVKDAKRIESLRQEFSWWTYCLAGGFNLLLYGVGSKRALVNAFREEQLSRFRTLTIDGFREDVTSKSILVNIVECMQLKNCERGRIDFQQKRRSLVDWAKHIASTIEHKKQQLIVLLNNIDSPNLRRSEAQRFYAFTSSVTKQKKNEKKNFVGNRVRPLPIWSKCNNIEYEVNGYQRLIALQRSFGSDCVGNRSSGSDCVGNISRKSSSLIGSHDRSHQCNSSMDERKVLLESFKWVYCRADTFAYPTEELLAGQSSLLGLTNSRSIFRLFYAMYFTTNEPVPFWDLFSAAKDDFLVSSDTALRQQLVEFNDHRVLR